MRITRVVPNALLSFKIEIEDLITVLACFPRLWHWRYHAFTSDPEQILLFIWINAKEFGVLDDLLICWLVNALVLLIEDLHIARWGLRTLR